MTAKKLAVGFTAVVALATMFFVSAPVIPLPVETQKQAMSVLYSDESYAEDVASKVAYILQRPDNYGFKSQEEVVHWLNGKSWVTADGGSRQIRVEPELLGDIGWPTVVNSVKVTLTYNRDGSSTTHHYYVHSSFGKV